MLQHTATTFWFRGKKIEKEVELGRQNSVEPEQNRGNSGKQNPTRKLQQKKRQWPVAWQFMHIRSRRLVALCCLFASHRINNRPNSFPFQAHFFSPIFFFLFLHFQALSPLALMQTDRQANKQTHTNSFHFTALCYTDRFWFSL